jgi:uncharacterized membrane protein
MSQNGDGRSIGPLALFDRLALFERPFLLCLYLAVLLPSAAIVSVLSPPFDAPDEPKHFARAAYVATGHIFAARLAGGVGAEIDRSYIAFMAVGRELVFGRQLDGAFLERASAIRLEGVTAPVLLPQTGVYPALLYVPQALGIRIAALFSDRVRLHLIGARVMNAAWAMAILSLAIRLFPPVAPALLMTAALPTSLFLIGSASQDASLIALSGLYLALILRVLSSSSVRPVRELIGAACVGTVLAFGRPPYIALMLPLIAAYGIRRGAAGWREASALSVIACLVFVAYWMPFGLTGTPMTAPGNDYAGQLAELRADPTLFVRAMVEAVRTSIPLWYMGGVGILGWHNAPIPRAAYLIYGVAMAISVAAVCLSFRTASVRIASVTMKQSLAVSFSSIGGFTMFVILTALLQYLVWTLPHANAVDGITGRYFIPASVVCLNGMLTPMLAGKPSFWGRSAIGLWNAILMAAVLASCALVVFTVRNRFYV